MKTPQEWVRWVKDNNASGEGLYAVIQHDALTTQSTRIRELEVKVEQIKRFCGDRHSGCSAANNRSHCCDSCWTKKQMLNLIEYTTTQKGS